MAHYLGLPSGNWSNLLSSGSWSGPLAAALVKQFDGDDAAIRGDSAHFWPYGLNYDSEWSAVSSYRQIAMVYAMRGDLGIGPKTPASSATVVNLTATDALGESGFNYLSTWNDNHFAHAGASYFTGNYGLRTPANGSSFTFAGDSLTLNNRADPNGGLLLKGTGTTAITTIRELVLDGGWIHHYTTTSDVPRIAGHITVASDSTIHAKQGDIVIASTISGTGGLTIAATDAPTTDARYVRFQGFNNTFAGSINVAGRFELGVGTLQRFVLGEGGVSNAITGPTAGKVRLNGTIRIEGNGIAMEPGASWTLVSAANTVYGDTFAVDGFTADAGVWTNGHGMVFSPATGRLTAVAAPGEAQWVGETSASWNAATNWGGEEAAAGRRLVFGAAGASGPTLSDNLMTPATHTIAGIRFTSEAPAYTLTPWLSVNGFSLSAGVVNESQQRQTIAESIAVPQERTRFTTSSGGGDLSVTGRISGAGGITKAGLGTLVLSGTSTYSGATRVEAGTLELTGQLAATSRLVMAGGTFAAARAGGATQGFNGLMLMAGDSTVAVTSGSGTVSLGGITHLAGGVVTFDPGAGGIATSASLTNGILGPWALHGSGTSARYATVSGGGVAKNISATVLSGSSVLGDVPSGDTKTVNYEVTSGGVFAAMGANRSINTLTSRGSGFLQAASNSCNLTVNGILNAGTGPVLISGNTPLGVIVGDSRELVVVAESSSVSLMHGVADNPAGASGLTKAGPSTLTLAGTSTYTGPTTVAAGILQIGNNTSIGFASPAIVNEGSLIFYHTNAVTYAGAISGHGAVAKAGAGRLTLTGPSSFDGPIVVSTGTLALAANATLGPLGEHAGGLSISTGAGLAYQASGYQRLAGPLSGNGSLSVTSGTLVLGAANPFTGGITVSTGASLLVEHPQAIGSARVLTVSGGRVQMAAGTALRGLTVTGLGAVDLGVGSMTVAAGGISESHLKTLVASGRGDGTWNGTTGIVSSATADATARGEFRAIGWIVRDDGGITVGYAAPGDVNLDGDVDLLDAAGFLAGGAFDQTTTGVWGDGDYNYDGLVDVLDVADALATNLFDTGGYLPAASAASSPIATVPEPQVSLLIGAAVAACGVRRLGRNTRSFCGSPTA